MSQDKPDWEAAVKEIAKTNEENRRLRKQIRGYKGQLARGSTGQSTENPNQPEDKPQNPPISEPQSDKEKQVKPHFLGDWQAVCPDCGEKNAKFKDETKCTHCGMHLGAVDNLKNVKACPSCGAAGDIAERISHE